MINARIKGFDFDEARTIPPDFDAATYLDLNHDVKQAGLDAHAHYMIWGHAEGRRHR